MLRGNIHLVLSDFANIHVTYLNCNKLNPLLFTTDSFFVWKTGVLYGISGISCLHVWDQTNLLDFWCFCFRWKVHEDWVSQLKYYDSLRAVISCSNHPETALVIGELPSSSVTRLTIRKIWGYYFSPRPGEESIPIFPIPIPIPIPILRSRVRLV